VANLADILGTLAGILLSKWKLPMVPTFVVLSCGYLLASRREVDSVELPYLNRARLALTSTHFLKTGARWGVGLLRAVRCVLCAVCCAVQCAVLCFPLLIVCSKTRPCGVCSEPSNT
jgi:hypothetical protein